MLGYSNVTTKGQITLPIDLRKYFKLQPQSRVVILQESDGIKVKPVKDFLSLHGSVKAPATRPDAQKMRQLFIKYLSKRKKV